MTSRLAPTLASLVTARGRMLRELLGAAIPGAQASAFAGLCSVASFVLHRSLLLDGLDTELASGFFHLHRGRDSDVHTWLVLSESRRIVDITASQFGRPDVCLPPPWIAGRRYEADSGHDETLHCARSAWRSHGAVESLLYPELADVVATAARRFCGTEMPREPSSQSNVKCT